MYSGKKEIEMKDLKNKNLVLAAIAREWMVNKRIYTSYNKTRQILSYHMIYDIIFAK